MIDAPHRALRLALLPLLLAALAGCRTAHAPGDATSAPVAPAATAAPVAPVATVAPAVAPMRPADALAGPVAGSPDAELPARDDEPVCTTEGVPEGAPTRLADVVVPRLDDDSFDAWVSHLTPTSDELSWESVDWLPTYAQGVAQAQAQRRPLLLWAMNGHPLGCT